MNRVILVGRLVKDPELKRTNTDIPVVQFALAVNRNFTKNGVRQADFINCVAWRQQAENLAKFMRKGSQIGLEGQLQVRTYEDVNGQKKYITEVICDNIYFLETKGAREGGYNDVNNYDIPASKENNRLSEDPFANLVSGDSRSSENVDSSKNSEDPFADLKTSSGVSDDDLPF